MPVPLATYMELAYMWERNIWIWTHRIANGKKAALSC